MTTFDALDLMILHPPAAEGAPPDITVDGRPLCPAEAWPLVWVGLAAASGMLESSGDLTELLEAIAHGESLLRAGIVSREMLDREVEAIASSVAEFLYAADSGLADLA